MKPSFESRSLEKLDQEKIYQKARNLIDELRVHEEDLRDLYGDVVTQDIQKVKRIEDGFARNDSQENVEAKRLADLFEALVLDLGELSDWFGENAFTIKTSLYDDYVNGVDMVIEFRGGEEESATYLGVAADVTFSSNATEKFEKIRGHIDNGELGKVKYFSSEHMETQGELTKLPEVVIGVSKKTVMELSELWITRNQKEMAKHYAQLMILKQMREQLETFSLYSESIGKTDLSALFKERLAIIDGILATKKEIERESGWNITLDTVHTDIMKFLNSWKQSIAREENVA